MRICELKNLSNFARIFYAILETCSCYLLQIRGREIRLPFIALLCTLTELCNITIRSSIVQLVEIPLGTTLD